jgi:hypothetical protein
VIANLKAVAAKEQAVPLEFGPPVIYKPTDELLGELYLQASLPAQAQASFQADLARAPGRRLGTEGLAASTKQLSSIRTPGGPLKPVSVETHRHN